MGGTLFKRKVAQISVDIYNTGAIRLEGTSWIDQGGMESWGGFAGTVSFSSQTIDGEGYDPTGEATGSSPWHMSAS
jgi:hypothetical protein